MQLLAKVTSLFKKDKTAQEYFLALIVKEQTITAVIWEEKNNQVSIVDQATVFTEGEVDTIDGDSLLKLADQVIGLAEKNLPVSIKTTKTIFGLPKWWADQTAIKEPYLTKIKNLARELDLQPLGFVVIPEAITHLLRTEEGTPPTVLLIALDKMRIGVTLVRSGRIEQSKTVAKEGKSDSEAVASIIASFGNVEILPSRILLFDGQISLEEARQEFIAYPWTKELSFLHFPKIDILEQDFDTRAVISGAAKEMGFSFEEEKGEIKAKESPESQTSLPPPMVAHDLDLKTETPPTEEPHGEEKPFGFIKDHDVMEDLKIASQKPVLDEEEDEPQQTIQVSAKPKKPSINFLTILSPLTKIGSVFAAFRFPDLPFPRFHMGLLFPILLLIGLLTIIASLFIFIPKATITLIPLSRAIENNVQLAIDIDSNTIDSEKKKVPGMLLEATVEGDKEEKTTGKKTVCEKAKGEVVVYNKTENKKTFAKGTVLTGPGNIHFTLDDDVSIASTAAFELTPASVKAKVTAEQIGEEGNIEANTNLPFKDFPTSSYFAKSETAFSGGSKKEVVAVSKEDTENLLVALLSELREKAKDELSKKAEGNQIVDVDMKEEVKTKKFNKDVGEESETLKLTLAVSFSTLSYKNGDLLTLVGGEIEKAVPLGFTFQKDTFETKVSKATKEKNGETTLTIHYKAPLLATIDTERVKNAIVGKTKSATEGYLRSLPLKTFTVTQSISLPPPLDLLPQRTENITIVVEKL